MNTENVLCISFVVDNYIYYKAHKSKDFIFSLQINFRKFEVSLCARFWPEQEEVKKTLREKR